MGGAQKHMLHPYDNLDLSFGDWFEIASILYFGGDFDEKFDGINITWRYNSETKKIHIARNWGHARNNAPTLDDYEKEMQSHPAKAQMTAAINALRKLEPIIGYFDFSMFNCKWWFNMEYISPDNPQSIKYDHEALIIHNVTTLIESDEVSNKPYMKVLDGILDLDGITGLLQYAGINISHKSKVSLPKDYRKYYFEWIDSMHCILKVHGLGLKDTIKEYVYRCVVKESNIPWHKARKLADNVTGIEKHNITSIREGNTNEEIKRINHIGLSKNRLKTINRHMKPFKSLWDEFGAKRLEGISSSMVDNYESCIDRLQRCMEFNKHILKTKYYDTHRNVWDALQLDIARFENLDVAAVAIEGIVINYGGYKYKLTGAFPSINRICGAARYSLSLIHI